jgi:hypothetical protein
VRAAWSGSLYVGSFTSEAIFIDISHCNGNAAPD